MPGTKKILEDAQLAKYRPVSVLQVLGDGGGRESYRPDAVRMYMVPWGHSGQGHHFSLGKGEEG